MNSIYCSPAQIKVLMGESDVKSIELDNYILADIPEGSMINGIITDEEKITDVISELVKEYALDKDDSYLVIDSNSIMTKTMDVPAVSEYQIVEFIEREFSLYSEGEPEADKLYDYTVLNPQAESGGATILAVSVSQGLIESYNTVFSDAGIDLKGINISTNALIKLARFVPQLQSGTYVLAMVEGKNLTLTLFHEGEYSLSNKYRLINMIGTEEWQNEIGDNLSTMLQFNKGHKGTGDIHAVHFTGMLPEEIKSLKKTLEYLNIKIDELNVAGSVIRSDIIDSKGDFTTGSFLYNIGNLLKK